MEVTATIAITVTADDEQIVAETTEGQTLFVSNDPDESREYLASIGVEGIDELVEAAFAEEVEG